MIPVDYAAALLLDCGLLSCLLPWLMEFLLVIRYATSTVVEFIHAANFDATMILLLEDGDQVILTKAINLLFEDGVHCIVVPKKRPAYHQGVILLFGWRRGNYS